jgi:hypothetical protein
MNGQLEISETSFSEAARRWIADVRRGDEANTVELFAAAREGGLRTFLADRPETGNAVLYRVVSDLVYERLTRPIERGRGHRSCLVSVARLEADCHDRHQDDVAAVWSYLLRHCDQPIANLPGWLASRLTPITIDAHRARRGALGALQRPRLPRWLVEALGSDTWLCWLALGMLTWAGVPAAVSNGLWPLGAWAEHRARMTGTACTEPQVERDVERVRRAMCAKAGWYERYVEVPLGRKRPALVTPLGGDGCGVLEDGAVRGLPPLSPAEPGRRLEVWLHEAAAAAIAAIEERVAAGEQVRAACISVLSEIFASGAGAESVDCVPSAAPDYSAQVELRLADPASVDRIADALLEIIAADAAPRRPALSDRPVHAARPVRQIPV